MTLDTSVTEVSLSLEVESSLIDLSLVQESSSAEPLSLSEVSLLFSSEEPSSLFEESSSQSVTSLVESSFSSETTSTRSTSESSLTQSSSSVFSTTESSSLSETTESSQTSEEVTSETSESSDTITLTSTDDTSSTTEAPLTGPTTTSMTGNKAYTLTIISPDSTVVQVVSLPLSTTNDLQHSTSLRNAKLIGGLVGLIGGVLVIGLCVVMFIILKRRRNRVANQLPDFHDSLSLEEKGFKKLFSNPEDADMEHGYTDSVAAGGYGAAGFSRGASNLYRPAAASASASGYGNGHSNPPYPEDDEYVYRGVANLNLDLVFRGPSTKSTSRDSNKYLFEDPRDSTTDDDFDFNDYDDDLITTPPRQQHSVFGNLNGSNNSQSRFHEEI